MTHEHARLEEATTKTAPWRKWGPYLSERQWGTVREDYSLDGNAWGYFSHDQARSRAYRWGEDGLGGISDDQQRLCFAVALWNGKDPILKERMFGLTNAEGNHGEDVKEYYFYVDSTPTHSYMKFLYKYPIEAYPYDEIVRTNRERGRNELEFELVDTGVFKHGYWDVVVEYAKQGPDDISVRISVTNHSPGPAKLHVLPTLWFRNTWSWVGGTRKPALTEANKRVRGASVIAASHEELGDWFLHCAEKPPLLFVENETNNQRCFGICNAGPYVKDGINDYVVRGQVDAINPAMTGTKAAAHYQFDVKPGGTQTIQSRLSPTAAKDDPFGQEFAQIFAARKKEADEFYAALTPPSVGADAANVMRQAFAGMLWSKQFYYYDINSWLEDHFPDGTHAKFKQFRNSEWVHMVNADVISMPDKWEYPWYAAWDLAFHCVPLALVDPDFAKKQIQLMLKETYLHPNGQIPAYEWNFGDVNPPVHAWAAYYVYQIDKQNHDGVGDVQFLKLAFQKLLLNFTWWVNRKDRTGRNVFEGGFLGLDNIGVFDRSAPLPTGGCLEQADGTAWMAFYSQSMLEIALELCHYDPLYEDFASKFTEHFLSIAAAMDRVGEHADEMWDEEDGFFYDVLRLPDGTATRLKVRSMVGLLSLCATTVISAENAQDASNFVSRSRWFLERHPELIETIPDPRKPGVGDRHLLALLDEKKLRRILTHMLDENEFLCPFGIRSLSRRHAAEPFIFHHGGQEFRVDYAPAESTSGLFGGNSNWRGPVWMPVNLLLIRGLLKLYAYYGDEFKIECPTGSGVEMTLFDVAGEISRRLTAIFCRDATGRRPVYGAAGGIFQDDPNWRDNILFYEYFHGDNGAGIGANHQTGWTGAVAALIQVFGWLEPRDVLEGQTVGKAFRSGAARPSVSVTVPAEPQVAQKRYLAMPKTILNEQSADFSMVLGGPLYQLLLRARVIRPPMDLLMRRMLVISGIAWIPPFILAIIAGRAWGGVRVPFLCDFDAHVRFLVSLPLLVLAEWVVHLRFRPLILQFLERDIVTNEERERFDRIVESSLRLRNSVFVEVALLLLVFSLGPILWRHQAALNASTWYADVDSTGFHLVLPGIVYTFVSLPLFQFILLRWYFRLFIWYRFIWKVSRLKLNLIPTHPDGSGGLGFLTSTAHALTPLLVAQSALLAGTFANRIFYEGAKLVDFKSEILIFVVFLLLQALGPLLMFAPAIAACQRAGNRLYGMFASQYVAEFHRKWIAGDPPDGESALGSGDIQSLADLGNSFAVIRSMTIVPFGKATVLRLGIVALLPLLPLALTVVPFDQLLDHLLKALL